MKYLLPATVTDGKLAQSNCSENSTKVSDCNSLQNGKDIKSQTVEIIMATVYGMNILEGCITQSAGGIRIYLLTHSNVTLAPAIAPAGTGGS